MRQTKESDPLQLSTFGHSLTKSDSPCGKILYIVKTKSSWKEAEEIMSVTDAVDLTAGAKEFIYV